MAGPVGYGPNDGRGSNRSRFLPIQCLLAERQTDATGADDVKKGSGWLTVFR
jgi:hypothetical protein